MSPPKTSPFVIFLAVVLAILLIGGTAWLLYLLVSATDQTRLAVLTAAISVATLVYTQNRNSKREVEARHFSKKADAYEEIVGIINDMMIAGKFGEVRDDAEFAKRIAVLRAKLIVWAGPDVIKAWQAMEGGEGDGDPFGALVRGNNLFAAIRNELGHTNDESLGKIGIVSLFLKAGEAEKFPKG